MTTAEWVHHAACRTEDPELFFPLGNTGPSLAQIAEAQDICRGCPVRGACLDDAAWATLCESNRPSTQVQLVKCAWCWNDHQRVQWMRTYDMAGVRVVSHQPGEGDDHPYQSVETPQHRAYNQRVARVGEAEGYGVVLEARADDGATRADVLLHGELEVAYEHQHSPFKKGHGALERTRLALGAGRDSVLWHTDDRAIAKAARVAMARSDDLPVELIGNPRYRIQIVSGFRELMFWTCTARDGHLCPKGRVSGCGEVHARSEPRGIALDDMVRQAPAGLVLPIHVEGVAGPQDFLTDLTSYRHYEDWSGRSAAPVLDGRPSGRRTSRTGKARGHSLVGNRPAPATLPPTAQGGGQRPLVAPVFPPPVPGKCTAGCTPCGRPARLYPEGWRCERCSPAGRRARQRRGPPDKPAATTS